MATSVVSAGLKAAADKVILASRPVVEVIKLFSTNFSLESAKKGDGVAVEVMSATASDFGTSNGYTVSTNTIAPASVLLTAHKKSTYTIGDKDALENELAPCWSNFAPTSGKAVARAIVQALFGVLDYSHRADYITKNAATLADFADVRAAVVNKGYDPSNCVLVLIPEYYAKLLAVIPTNILGENEAIRRAIIGELLGFKAVIESPNADTVSGAASEGVTPKNGIGFVVPTGAVAVAGRVIYPVREGGNLLEFGTIQDDETGLAFGTRVVLDADQGTCSWTVDALFGVSRAKQLLPNSESTYNGAPGYLQLLKA